MIDVGSEARFIINKHASKGVLIDTCLLLLYFAGIHSPSLVGHEKLRLSSYEEKDYLLLKSIVSQFHKVFVTPQILAEVSNLSHHLNDTLLQSYYSNVISILSSAHEAHVLKDKLLQSLTLPKIGFTDTSILEYATTNKMLVITDDWELYQRLRTLGCECINFTILRGL